MLIWPVRRPVGPVRNLVAREPVGLERSHVIA
jgi:hypothetical protein